MEFSAGPASIAPYRNHELDAADKAMTRGCSETSRGNWHSVTDNDERIRGGFGNDKLAPSRDTGADLRLSVTKIGHEKLLRAGA